ncbi:GUN4 domain-containing protein [Tolypothrix sp. FACHB-123]|uniref:serine/threonine-protein kinase n=1 Tax=Tolypothrix sp. FACHB-123 TaxID=2692868 RepID=UPI0016864541|nr:serine/threonine-protein kinase [Tolypothrix sp. FACHB-123]MBD2356519.1 GUN4 domain-containing protein [Tolypothrix sp. FACHB-123]
MKLCPNIDCLYPHNVDTARFCIRCGKQLLLKDRYHLLHLIGRGGFGITFLAVDEQDPTKSHCVIKQFCCESATGKSFEKAVELFRQEAVRLGELQHPQIPQLLEYFELDTDLYLVEEWIPGKTLAEELETQGLFSEAQIWEILQQLLPVLQFIHVRQVIHRDIKPANIMRRSAVGGTGKDLVLIDFGVAKQITATALLYTGTTVGSPGYMAPEQMRGKALPASDLYGLGVSCIYLLTGISPFDLFDETSDRWVWRDYILNKDAVSNRLAAILDKLVQNSLPQRYKSAAEALVALNCAIKLESSQAGKPKPGDNLKSPFGVDYHHLRDLLVLRQWQAADKQTWALMCQAIKKPIGSYLFTSDIENFPCEDLEIIDELWKKYSKGRFGFSIQKQIYDSVDGDYGKFCTAIGWNLVLATSSGQQLSFRLSAPPGHLPSHAWAAGTQLWRHMSALNAKLANC